MHIREVTALDALALAPLLGVAVDIPKIVSVSPQSACFLAEDSNGNVLGFQGIVPARVASAAEIATIVKKDAPQLAVGSKLFEATKDAARRVGFVWIDANVSDEAALTYYRSRGFEPFSQNETHLTLRYDLR